MGSTKKYRPVERTSGKWVITRREFLGLSMTLAAGVLFGACGRYVQREGGSRRDSSVRIGVVTDSHYAELDPLNNRFYSESLEKMTECVELMNDMGVDLLIELGDFMNGAPENNIEHLKAIEAVFSTFDGPRYHVLGNHDMDGLSKAQFQSEIENTEIPQASTFYSFDRDGLHIVVLDANYTSDGSHYDTGNFHWTDSNIPAEQLEWLAQDLEDADRPVIVCVHQLLDEDEGSHYINNAAEVRQILEESGKVLAVFQGHQHQGQYNLVNGIHYVTFRAMVEGSGRKSSAYSIVEVDPDRSMTITGYRRAETVQLQSEV